MAGEDATDVGLTLTLRAENEKDMLECLDRFNTELRTRSKSIQDVATLFEVVQTNTLLSANTEELKIAASKFAAFMTRCQRQNFSWTYQDLSLIHI